MNELEDRSSKVSSHKEKLSKKCKNTVFWLLNIFMAAIFFKISKSGASFDLVYRGLELVMLIIYLNVGFRVRFSFLDYKKLRWQLTSVLSSTQRKSESGKSVPTSGLSVTDTGS